MVALGEVAGGGNALRDPKQDFSWSGTLRHRQGAPSNLEGIDVFFDFDWHEEIGHPQTQFKNGLCLARRVKKECPAGKKPALLLTVSHDVEEKPLESDTWFVVVVNLNRYLEVASADPSAAYFGDASGPGLTRISQISAVSRLSPDDMRAFLDLNLTADDVDEWATTDGTRMTCPQGSGRSWHRPRPELAD
jgi:hypothetical protein